MRRMELVLADATIGWVAVRPPRLLTKKPKGTYHLGLKPGQIGRDITIPDLAAALIDLAEKAQPTGAFYISNQARRPLPLLGYRGWTSGRLRSPITAPTAWGGPRSRRDNRRPGQRPGRASEPEGATPCLRPVRRTLHESP